MKSPNLNNKNKGNPCVTKKKIGKASIIIVAMQNK